MEDTDTTINSEVVELIIKSTHVFKNIHITFWLCVIKVSLKSDIAIVWIDIWDSQNRSVAKTLTNHHFNVGSHITIIYKANMNSGISQYKNCWKWEYNTFTCRVQESKCVKYNRSHKVKHYCHFAWYCKANFKINLSHLKTKQDKLYPHLFKCLNWKGDYQADSN